MNRMTVRHGWVAILVAALCLATTVPRPALAAPGDRLWIKGFAGSRQHGDQANSIAISPDGRTVFVTGEQGGLESSTIAYDAGSGTRLWAVHHDTLIFTLVAAAARRVFVTGESLDTHDFSTMALDADTGAVQWKRRYHGPPGSSDAPGDITLSPDGRSLFVTGPLSLSNGGAKEGTVAYRTSDGATLWSTRWGGTPQGDRSARIVASDSRVFVSTTSIAGPTRDYATLAYDAATGAPLWTRLYDGSADWDATAGVALGPHGASVFVTGQSWKADEADFVTIGYRASDGSPLWTSRYAGPRAGYDTPVAITTSPDRAELYVTGLSSGVAGVGLPDYATVALDTVTGTQLWASRYDGPPIGQYDAPIAMSANDTNVFVTGTSASTRQYACDDGPTFVCYDRDVLTIAYSADAGARSWVRRYSGSGERDDRGSAIVVGPEGGRIFVAGEQVTTAQRATFPRWVTIAYDTR
jgi:outer membrane protein assembly factor BamB